MADVHGSKLKVLVADDSKTIRLFLVNALKTGQDSIEVQEAADGLTCHRHLSSGYFDIAFVDVNMPGMDGLTAVAKARAEGVETFTAIMSTESDRDKIERARSLRAYEYLSKPFDEGDVQTIVKNYCRLQTVSKVLLVDDSKITRSVIRKVLDCSFMKFAFYEACDGESALELLNNERFDIVFLDVNMPGISGVEVLADLRKRYPDIAVIMITADRDTDISASIGSLNVHHTLYKPFFPQDVDRCLHQLFGLQTPELGGGSEEVELL